MKKKKLTREDVIKIVEEARKNGERPNLSKTDLSKIDFSNVNTNIQNVGFFRRTNFCNTDFTNSNLSGTKLTDTDLSEAHLIGADLRRAHLFGADLSYADLRRSRLEGSNLSGSILSGANLSSTYLSRADFSQATIGYTIFADVDLSEVKGLDTVHHFGPSEISISTLYKSKGKIPDVFLRGCGVPDNFIEYVHSLTNDAFDYYSCFISHSTKDKPFVEQLYANLQANGVRCWYAPHDMQGGKKVHEQIDHAIRVHEKLLLILSENSMESDWVKTEIRKAKKREEKEGKRVLFPISLVPFSRIQEWEFFDSDRGRDLATEIREFYIPCFAGWEQNHDAYKKEFDKLLRDLKASEQSGG